jgi:hypothetical protein
VLLKDGIKRMANNYKELPEEPDLLLNERAMLKAPRGVVQEKLFTAKIAKECR